MNSQTNDVLEVIAKVLLRCWLFGFVLLLTGLGVYFFKGFKIYMLASSTFELTQHEFQLLFYCGIGLLKICVLMFFFIPWLSIKLVLRNSKAN